MTAAAEVFEMSNGNRGERIQPSSRVSWGKPVQPPRSTDPLHTSYSWPR